MSARPRADLEDGARRVLDQNRRGAFTCPSNTLYPHQWLWDSCFIAIGIARYDAARAADEMRALFRGQWSNGMLPHIMFGNDSNDIGSRRIWQSKRNPLAPRDIDTSCVTQPPLPAIAGWRVARVLPEPERHTFLAELFPKLVAYHSWLYDERDRHNSGLVTLIHPWECGLDTTPPWMQALCRMPLPWWLRLAERLDLARAVRRVRNDTRYIPAAERASDDEGLRMLVLATRGKKHDFRLKDMPAEGSVLIEDLAFNAILAVANRSLALIANEMHQPLPEALLENARRTDAALEQLWDEQSGQYYSRSAVTGELIKVPTIATFIPLWAGVPSAARAERLIELLRRPASFWPRYPVPSVPLDSPEFREAGYWKGPTWVNTGWLIVEALHQYGHGELAEELRDRILDLVANAGFSEYFSPLTGAGYGADDFSWTAALVIDLVTGDDAEGEAQS
jgi:Glycosyl hydrolase family 63 C-terminal domain